MADPVTTLDGSIDALIDPGLDPAFWPPSRTGVASAWITHVPFAHWLVVAHRPRSIVELGTHSGVSYAAFCEAVLRGGLSCRCRAVDTWEGDAHAGRYGGEVFAALEAFHAARYAGFSDLVRSTFDAALDGVADGSVDLLHIDGLHTYEAVRHDFESWLPKLSERAVVLLHDTNVRDGGFGVWRLFAELAGRYPSFEFLHGFGLGVLAVGRDHGAAAAALTGLSGRAAGVVRERFSFLGERWLATMPGEPVAEARLFLAEDEPVRAGVPIEPAPDAALRVMAGTVTLPLVGYEAGWHRYAATGVGAELRLVSRTFGPSDFDPASADRRRLGVAVWGVRLLMRGGARQVDLCGGLLGAGWHEEEARAGCAWRWTDGDAVLTLPEGVEAVEIATTQRV